MRYSDWHWCRVIEPLRCQKLISAVYLIRIVSSVNTVCLYFLLVLRGSLLTSWETAACNNESPKPCTAPLDNSVCVSKSFRTGRLERELQMVHLSTTRCSCIAILWVSLVSFAVITFCVASQRVFIVVVYFVIESVRKLLDTPSHRHDTCNYPAVTLLWWHHWPDSEHWLNSSLKTSANGL
jgi:hypothetical protein